MTPRQARFALCGFLLVAGGVAVNALFLQQRSTANGFQKQSAERAQARRDGDRARKIPDPKLSAKPAARSPSTTAEERRTARFNPDSAKLDALPEAPDSDAAPETVRAIQRELAQRGYGPLQTDGFPGLATRAAIMAYEFDKGLALTGEASEALLTRVLLGAPGHTEAGRAGMVQSNAARLVIRSVQQALATQGFKPGRSDGRLSEDTIRAIREFEVEQGLFPRGRISAEVVTRLEAAGAPMPPATH